MVEVRGKNLHLNRCLTEMGVAYNLRPAPPGAIPRMIAPGNVGSEIPPTKSKGKAKAKFAGTSDEVVGEGGKGRVPKPSSMKASVKKAESAKRKAQE